MAEWGRGRGRQKHGREGGGGRSVAGREGEGEGGATELTSLPYTHTLYTHSLLCGDVHVSGRRRCEVKNRDLRCDVHLDGLPGGRGLLLLLALLFLLGFLRVRSRGIGLWGARLCHSERQRRPENIMYMTRCRKEQARSNKQARQSNTAHPMYIYTCI